MAAANEPITEMVINSMITAEGLTLRAGESADFAALSWDGGYGIARVEIELVIAARSPMPWWQRPCWRPRCYSRQLC